MPTFRREAGVESSEQPADDSQIFETITLSKLMRQIS